MRLEDWRKWLEEQFLDTNPPGAKENGADEATKSDAPAPAPQPPPKAPESQETVPATQESVRPQVSAAEPPVVRPTQTSPHPPQATVPKAQVPAASSSLSVEVPHIEEYLPFLKPRRPVDSEPSPSVPTPQPVILSQGQPARHEADTIPAPPAPTTAPVQTEVTTTPVAETVVAPAVVEAPRREELAEVEPSRAGGESRPTQPAVQDTATSAVSHDIATGREEPVRTSGAVTEMASQKSSSLSGRKRRARSAKHVTPPELAPPLSSDDFWKLAPRHIRTLIAMGHDEGVQRSYRRPFKESRLALIERLLDPTLSLEETARLLNVCPATVRRYTNRGQLRHFRTEGDQRRFRLSDVLAFMEAQMSEHRDSSDSR